MKHLFVPYEIALQLKEKGFDEFCLKSYGDDKLLNENDHEIYLSAPLYQQVIDWLRLEKKILVAERWEGWKYGDFNWGWFIYCETKEEAITEALKLI